MKIVQISADPSRWPGIYALMDTGAIFYGDWSQGTIKWREINLPTECSHLGADYSVTEQVEGS